MNDSDNNKIKTTISKEDAGGYVDSGILDDAWFEKHPIPEDGRSMTTLEALPYSLHIIQCCAKALLECEDDKKQDNYNHLKCGMNEMNRAINGVIKLCPVDSDGIENAKFVTGEPKPTKGTKKYPECGMLRIAETIKVEEWDSLVEKVLDHPQSPKTGELISIQFLREDYHDYIKGGEFVCKCSKHDKGKEG